MSSRKIDFSWDDSGFGIRAAGIMFDEKNRVLLCRVADDPQLDFWVLPGGGINLHETLKETVSREFYEESNFEIEVHQLLFVEEGFFNHEGKKIHGIGFYFLVSPKKVGGIWEQDEFMGQEEEMDPDRVWNLQFKWFHSHELDELEVYPLGLKGILDDYPNHENHIVNKSYKDE